MSENNLQHVIIGQAIVADRVTEALSVLALSDNLSEESVAALQQAVTLTPLAANGQRESQTVALAMLTNGKVVGDASRVYVLARSHYQKNDQTQAIYQYIRIPCAILDDLDGDIQPLLRLIDEPIQPYAVTHAPLEPLPLPTPVTSSLADEVTLLNTTLNMLADGDIQRLLALLGAALDGSVIICGFPSENTQRLILIRGLALLLPKIARSHLTFSSNDSLLDGRLPRIVFSDVEGVSNTRRFDWNHSDIDASLLDNAYIAHLQSLWNDDIQAFVTAIKSLSALATTIMPGYLLMDGLQAVTERHQYDLAVVQREPIAAENIMTILDGNTPPQDALRVQYLEQLLQRALDDRNTEAAQRVAQEMDADADLDAHLDNMLADALITQPDAVYVFTRTRLAEGNDSRWLQWLHDAAQQSLDVAIESGDADTLSSWLNLISREPSRYELADILRLGILAARKRAPDSPKLIQDLLVMSVKRQPDTLSTLLHDPQVMSLLPEEMLNAIERFDSSAIDKLFTESRELFLLAIKRAIDEGELCITNSIIRNLWDIYTQPQAITLAPDFRPLALLRRIAKNTDILVNGALETLLTLILANSHDDLFFEITPHLARQGVLSGVMASSLQQSGRELPELITIINQLTSREILEAQDAVSIYADLLTYFDSPQAMMPLVEQVARVLVQHPETTASINIMWKIAEYSGEMKSESMMRVAMRRLLHDIEQMVSQNQVVENIQRLRQAIIWSATGRTMLIRWWRQHTRSLGLGQLQKLDKALEGKRPLEDLRAVVQTSVALRRVIGQRTLEEFASDIHVTFTILQALSESFDPDGKVNIHIDSATMRGELEAREDELPTEMRQVLATNLKELAQLITTLSDNRSKPSIIRRDEAVERQLSTGEAQPHSAIDVMRWLSGYLVGVQKNDDTD
ncbi:MAG: hypothetical protein Q9P44_04955 [Anaerolineae bacterium]|nr:hypothetical protein [Anaerolineae bacterium]